MVHCEQRIGALFEAGVDSIPHNKTTRWYDSLIDVAMGKLLQRCWRWLMFRCCLKTKQHPCQLRHFRAIHQ